MPSYKEIEKVQTPGIKLTNKSIVRMKYLAKIYKMSQSKLIEMLIDEEYKRSKQNIL